jgi:osmotically-inducible protein OsmY
MKKCLLYLACTAIALSLTQGCTQTSCLSPYKAGTDERSLGVCFNDMVIKDKIKARLLKDERIIQIAQSTKSVEKVAHYFLPKARKSTAANDAKIAAKVKGTFLSDINDTVALFRVGPTETII